jgi:UDP-glucose 4-epimerase
VRRLLRDPTKLEILGDGNQSKSYVHVEDVIDAVLLAAAEAPRPFATYNVATGDYVTVREIAALATEVLGIDPGTTKFVFGGGDRGWRGDVPVVRLNTDRIRALGWANARSTREAISASLEAMLLEARVGRLT